MYVKRYVLKNKTFFITIAIVWTFYKENLIFEKLNTEIIFFLIPNHTYLIMIEDDAFDTLK